MKNLLNLKLCPFKFCLQVFIFFQPLFLFSQYTKSFTDINEYRFSNKVLEAVESQSYNYGVSLMDSVLSYTDSPDRYIVLNGITCYVKTYKKDQLLSLLKIARKNEYSLRNAKNKIEAVYPEMVTNNPLLFAKRRDSILLFDIGQELAQMFVDDQVCRTYIYQPIIDKSRDLGYEISVNNEMPCKQVDSVNTVKLKNILSTYPNLNKDDVGKWGMNGIFAVIQHSGKENMKYFKPQMDKWYANEDIRGSSYAFYIDRILLHDKKPQVYGTQVTRDENNKLIFYPIKDIYKIEELRMKMGMTDIRAYARHFNIDWNEYVKIISKS